MPRIQLNKAGIQDTEVIERLAVKIWNQHYPSIITQEQINYMLNRSYNQESLRQQLTELGHQFFLIRNDDKTIGFVSVHMEDKGNWFINKFYIDQEFSAKGIGTKALAMLIKTIDPQKITLTVNRQNFKSINFYFRNGFVIDRVADFDIGNGFVMNDFVMVWTKKPKLSHS
mgnify:CR=1 FL=1